MARFVSQATYVARFSLPAFLLSTAAWAQDATLPAIQVPGEQPNLELNTPATTGSRLGLTPMETPASLDIIRGDVIRERGQQSISDAVTKNAPGVSSVAAPIYGTAYSMRGFQGNNSVTQLYDGTRLAPGRGNISYPFDTWSVDRIEVLHGPASVLYGDGAIGGAINVVPKKPLETEIRNEAEVSFDSNLQRRAAAGSGGRIVSGLAYQLNIVGDQSDGWVDDGDTSKFAFSGGLAWQAHPDWKFTLSSDYGLQKPMAYFGTPLRNGEIDKSLHEKNYNVANSLIEFEDSWTQFKTEWSPGDGVKVNNTLYYMASEREWRNAETFFLNTTTNLVERSGFTHIRQEQEQVGNRADVTLKYDLLGHRNETTIGFDINRSNFQYASYFPGTTDSVNPYHPVQGSFPNPNRLDPQFDTTVVQSSLFAEDRFFITSNLTAVGGLRLDRTEIDRTDRSPPTTDGFEKGFHSTGWRGGLVYTPFPNLAFYGQYAVATDPLNVPMLDYTQTTANLKLTTGRQIELGVKNSLLDNQLQWSLAGYKIVKKNLLAREPGSFAAQQIGEQSSFGAEAAVSYAVSKAVTVGANAGIVQAEFENFRTIDFMTFTVEDYKGKRPILIPRTTGNLWADWAFARDWKAMVDLQYVGGSYEDFANTVERDPYTLVNVGLQWAATRDLVVTGRVLNVFDKVYAQYMKYDTDNGYQQGFLGQPRTFVLTANVKF